MRGLLSILSLFRNKFNKFNNTRARMLDSIYHMKNTLKSDFWRKNVIISLVPNSVTTIFGFSLIGRRETIRKTDRRRKDVSNLFNRFMIYKGQTCVFII